MRREYDILINKAENLYNYRLNYLSPDVYTFIMKQRHPAQLVRKMVRCIPEGREYDFIYEELAIVVYEACNNRLIKLHQTFWFPMSYILIGILGSIDTEWKQRIMNHWVKI